MPEGAIYVGRPTKWGNPLTVGKGRWINWNKKIYLGDNHKLCVDFYREWISGQDEDFSKLRGHDLVCWCPLDQPCHADVLLELANKERK